MFSINNGCIVINDKAKGPRFKSEECILYPFHEGIQGLQAVTGIVWSGNAEHRESLAISTNGGIVHFLNIKHALKKMRIVKRE